MVNTVEMTYVGHNHFSSKNTHSIYYIIQVLFNTEDAMRNINKATLINVFVDDKDYQKLCVLEIGSTLKVEVKPNLETGKVSYKILK